MSEKPVQKIHSKSCACSITEGNVFQNIYSANRKQMLLIKICYSLGEKKQRNLTSLQLAVRTKIFMHLHYSDGPR